MGIILFRGDAPAVAQVDTLTVGGTVEAGDIFISTISVKTLPVSASSTNLTTTAEEIADAWNASEVPEYMEATAESASAVVTVTADTAGKPFTVTASTTESNGGAADAQAFVRAAVTASEGPYHWDTAENWNGGAVPVNSDDVYLSNSAVSIKYGLAQSAVTLTSLNIDASYTGQIGLAPYDTEGGTARTYYQYRATLLNILATTVNVGLGTGGGSSMIRLDLGANATTINVYSTGAAQQGSYPLYIKGSASNYTLNVFKGHVGVATEPGHTATLPTVRVGSDTNPTGDARLVLGTGCTITTVTVTAGQVEINANTTTINAKGGTVVVLLAATVGTLTADAGTIYYQSSGTCTTLTVNSDAVVDFSRDPRARTVTNCTIRKGGKIYDPYGTVTFTNGIILTGCKLDEVKLDVGDNRTLTVS